MDLECTHSVAQYFVTQNLQGVKATRTVIVMIDNV